MLIDLIPTVVMFGGHMMVGGSWGGCADGMNVPPGLQQQGRGGGMVRQSLVGEMPEVGPALMCACWLLVAWVSFLTVGK